MKCGDDWKGDQYLYRYRDVLAIVGPMGRGAVGGGGSEWVSWCGGGSMREVVRFFQVIVC
jgi:hypothetical protein